jgi:hypothetical protein
MRALMRLRRSPASLALAAVLCAVSFTAGLALTGGEGARPSAASTLDVEIGDVSQYPLISGGRWVRGPNLVDARGRFQPRQEHAAVELNGFVYLIGGFVPIQPPPQPTENEPEPFPFQGTGQVLVYTPEGHAAGDQGRAGTWTTLSRASWFPVPDMHHIIAVAHRGRIWAFGGHAGGFEPTRRVFVFTPESPTSPEGRWDQVSVASGERCRQAATCLRLPRPRAAGAAVSVGNRIYVMGGVEPYVGTPDPVNASIRTTNSVIFLDTESFPLRWELAPALREPREHFNAVVASGRIWAFHGRSELSTHMRGAESWRPGEWTWRREQDAPVGTSANILAAVGECVYSFGGEFIASNVTGTLEASQVFHLPSRSWRRLRSTVRTEPLDATGATSKHGTYGVTFVEEGTTKIMAPGGAATAWFDPMSKVHVFIPPGGCG